MKSIFIIFASLALLTFPTTGVASNCNQWQAKVKSTQRKISNGGNQSQIKQWDKALKYYVGELEKCNKKIGRHHWISVTSKPDRKTHTRNKPEKQRVINADTPELQQMIATCNYWIRQYNTNANEVNSTFKTTACRNADKAMQTPATKTTETFIPSRPLKECVKPDNRIDDEVKNCMLGKIEPSWPSGH